MRPRQSRGSCTTPVLGWVCYIVPGTSFGEEMDSMKAQHGRGGTRDFQAAVLSILASKTGSIG
jgi:hypothetical protein